MKIGDRFHPFQLKGTDGELKDVKTGDERIKVVIFTCNHCPYAIAYVKRIHALIEHYADQAVDFYAINSNDSAKYPQDAFERMPEMAMKLGIGANYLHDESQQIAAAYGASRTPEVFVFSMSDDLVYSGAIDDNWQKPLQVSTKYLQDALDLILNNEAVLHTQITAVGCSIKWKQ